MTDSGSDGPSFDPRRWGGAKPDTGAAVQADPTFDPKSWSHKSASAPLEVYTLAACFYLAITSLLSLAGREIERRVAQRA